MFQLPISTLRYYDKEGLFPHLKRVNGVRQFSESEIETLRVIDCLKRSGLEIKDIKIKNQIEEQIKNIEENNNIKNAIIKEEMYKQGLKDGINLIILCQNH